MNKIYLILNKKYLGQVKADKILDHTFLEPQDFHKTNQQCNSLARWDHQSHMICLSHILHICLHWLQSMFRLILDFLCFYLMIIPIRKMIKPKLSIWLEALDLNIRIQRYSSPANSLNGFHTLNRFQINSSLCIWKRLKKLALVPGGHGVHTVAFALEKYPGLQKSCSKELGHW